MRPLAKELFSPDKEAALIVVDGRYVYIQKSSHFTFQRHTYSVQKGRPLLKPFFLVSTTGYILDVLGPYYADGRNNDAAILNANLRSDAAALRAWLHKDDVFIVDRGFRDSVSVLEDMDLM